MKFKLNHSLYLFFFSYVHGCKNYSDHLQQDLHQKSNSSTILIQFASNIDKNW